MSRKIMNTASFPVPSAFAAQANVDASTYEAMVASADRDFEAYWAEMAQSVSWFTPWTKVLEWDCPDAKWFVGAKTNAAYNCTDRHVATWRRNKAALIWEGEPGERHVFTYQQMLAESSRLANALTRAGVKTGDRVAIYLPPIPEILFAMLACARLGVTHVTIYQGYSPPAVRDRIEDAQAKLVITADGQFRRGETEAIKANLDVALEGQRSVEKVVVVRRTGQDVAWVEGRDVSYEDFVAGCGTSCPYVEVDSEHPLYILYTSGTTGKPKGVFHSTGGYLVGTSTTARVVFDMKDTDLVWTTSNPAWPTGHAYVLYGAMSLGATMMMYEGDPEFPHAGRMWEIVEREGVNIFYTFPNDIRRFKRASNEYLARYDLSSLRLLGSVSEPLNEDDWLWLHHNVGRGKCPINDTWWQTECGATMITPVPGALATKPGSVAKPFPGIFAAIVDDDGNEVPDGTIGNLAITRPWPSMLRGVYGDKERFKRTYWEKYQAKGYYFPGDRAVKDTDGYFWMLGRCDDVILVRGVSVGGVEVEGNLLEHAAVQQAVIVGCDDDETGQSIAAFVVPKAGVVASAALAEELGSYIEARIGPMARPKQVHFVDALPTTSSGKIMRRILKELAEGKPISGNTSTLDDWNVVERIQLALAKAVEAA